MKNKFPVKIHRSAERAPRYDMPEFKPARLSGVTIIKDGTIYGHPTLDLIFTDEQGQKFVAVVTAEAMRNIISSGD